MDSYIFDTAQGESPKTLALKRALAAQIMGAIGNKPARNAPEGIGNALASIGQGISANVLGRRADEAEKTGNAGANSLYNQLISGLTGGGMSGAGAGSSGLGGISGGGSGSGAPAIVSTDPVASGLEPEQAALLNGIAGPESAGKYNVRYTPSGGTNFSGFDRHPGIAEMGPEGPSTAAGRYQFTKTTWDGLPAAVKSDGTFSPENQDRAALYLAGQDYQKRTGRDLNADIKQNGMTPAIAAALGPTWAGLKTNARSAIANFDQSLSRYDQQQDAAQDAQMGEGPAVDMASLPAPVRTVMGGGGGMPSTQPTQTAGAGPVNVMSDDEIDAQFDPVTARTMKAIAAGVRGQQGQTAPGKPVQVASLGNVANDASPPGAFGGAPAQPAFSPFAPEFNRDPSQFRQPAPQMAAMPLGMMSGGAFSGDSTGSIPPQAQPQPQPAQQPRSPFLPPPASPPAEAAPQPSPMPQRSPFLPPQMMPAGFEEAPGTIPGGGQIPPQMAQAMQAQQPQVPNNLPTQNPGPALSQNLPTQTPNLQAAAAQQPGQPQAGLGGADLPTLMKLASNPFIMANPGRAATVQALLKAKIEQQQKASDPVYQGQVQAVPLELQAKRYANEKAARELATPRERKTTTINGRLVDAQTGEQIADYQDPNAKAPTVQKLKLDDGSEMAVQWNGQTGAWDPINAPRGGGGIAPKTKLTENQSKLTLFQSLQTESQPVLLDLESQFNPANIADATARSTPIAGNFFQSERGQMYDAASTAWAEGALRIATGAAATPEEMTRTKKAYFAQPGDTPITIAFKAQMREMYNRSIERALGNKPDGGLPKPSEFVKQFTGEKPPAAATPAQSGVSRPASKAEFDALPSGAQFTAPDGSIRRKP